MDQKNQQVRRLQTIPNPRELMRARHPDLFSDARADKVPQLASAVFEYHLETLTSRKQEYEFEHFCRKLAEKEICPNLRVQTGPTGGGDSKVDAETYPVAAEIAERWWVGEPSAGAERWAFAFSAKQKAGISVHILDRGWIVAKVYDCGHLDLAISTLGIEGVTSENLRRPGPRDTARQAELEELDRQITDPMRYQDARYQLVEDCLRTAILARGLERPRNEVEARFAHADTLAQQLNFRPQRMRIAYNRAWTAYWWYQDYAAFGRLYDELEHYLEGSTEAAEVGRLVNLLLLLAPSIAAKQISARDARVAPRRERLLQLLQPIASDPARLNNALQGRTSLALIKINQSYQLGTADDLEGVWADLSQIMDESAALGS
jgi:hypothetical protein